MAKNLGMLRQGRIENNKMATKLTDSGKLKPNAVRKMQLASTQLEFLQAIYHTSPDMTFVLGSNGKIIDVNENALTQFQYQRAEFLTHDLAHFMGKKSQDIGDSNAFDGNTEDATYTEFQWVARCKNGVEFPVEVRMKKLPKGLKFEGKRADVLLAVRDIRDRYAYEEKIWRKAHFDNVTGLINRNLLEDRAHQALARCRRFKTKMAFLFLDLDHFKQVNDTLGHRVGDRLLKAASMRIQSTLRENDTFGRLGGDEFMILAEEISYADDAMFIGEKIIQLLSEPFGIEGHVINISASIGISLFPDHGSALQSLFDQSDKAMYRAKQLGRNKLAVYNPALNI